jgi:hypothetical protein
MMPGGRPRWVREPTITLQAEILALFAINWPRFDATPRVKE